MGRGGGQWEGGDGEGRGVASSFLMWMLLSYHPRPASAEGAKRS